jgi:drug/metabolite transporter (DMT)-like permease
VSDLSTAILAGLGGMVGWGTADFFAKRTIDRIGDVTSLFWAQAIGVVPLLAIFLVSRNVPELHRFDLVWLVLLGIISALSYLPVYVAFGLGQVSLLSPIFASYAALVVVLSWLFFGEHLSAGQWVAIAVVFLGVLLISTDPSDLRSVLRDERQRTAGLPQILTAVVTYSIWLVLLDRFIDGRDWVFFLLVIRSTATLTLFVYSRIRHQSLALGPDWRGVLPYLVLIGVFDVAAFSAVSYGFSRTDHVSIVAVLSSTFSLPTLILARLFLGERLVRSQFLAAGVILSSIVMVTVL